MVTPRHKGSLQSLVILDDPVMNNGNLAVAIQMRMGVPNIRLAMSRPTGMTDSDLVARRPSLVAGQYFFPNDHRGKVGQFPRTLYDREAAIVVESNASRVVAAIFKSPEAVEQNGHDRASTDVANDAAHKRPLRLQRRRSTLEMILKLLALSTAQSK